MANNNDRTLPPLIYRLQTGPYAGKTLDEVPSFYCKELMTGGESELVRVAPIEANKHTN